MSMLELIRQEIVLVEELMVRHKLLREAALTSPSGTTGPAETDPTDSTTSDEPEQPDQTPTPDPMAAPGGDPNDLSAAMPGMSGEPTNAAPAPVEQPPEPPKDPVTAAVDDAKELSTKTRDVPQVLKVVKATIQSNGLPPDAQRSVMQQLSASGDPTLVDVSRRLNQFLQLQEEQNMDSKTEQLFEQKLKQLISKMVGRRVRQLKEAGELDGLMPNAPQAAPPPPESSSGNANFDAVRSLGLKARQTALAFESDMRKELDLEDPNKMDKNSQELYAKAMDQFHTAMVASVTDAVEAIKTLPKRAEPEGA